MKKRCVVIGGGIHGLTAAIALSELDIELFLVEKNKELFAGTSGATHNRAHMGYHYPQCFETARECLLGLKFFQEKYPKALHYPDHNYYVIAREGSESSADAYSEFCKKAEIDFSDAWPPLEYLNRAAISRSFLVKEPIYDTFLLLDILEKEADSKNVCIHKNTELVGATRENDRYVLELKNDNKISGMSADIVINTTYTYSNNIISIFHLEEFMTRYRLQTTEIVVVKSENKIPPLTVMDGPFITILPYAGIDGHVLVYDAENSIINEEEGYIFSDPKEYPSNWHKMVEKGKKYFPFMDKLKYVQSLWGNRPIPLDLEIEQNRHTRLVKYEESPGFYSLLEGKFISAPLMAQEFKSMIQINEHL